MYKLMGLMIGLMLLAIPISSAQDIINIGEKTQDATWRVCTYPVSIVLMFGQLCLDMFFFPCYVIQDIMQICCFLLCYIINVFIGDCLCCSKL